MDANDNTENVRILIDKDKDYIEKCIGAFGVWQLKLCIIASMTRYTALSNMLSIIFLMPKTDFKCVLFESNTTREAVNSTCYEDCVEYEYSQDIFEASLISEFHLICARSWLASFTQTILMLGFVVGVSLFGWISDRYGRQFAFLIANYTNIILMIATPFAPDYWTFNVFRFLVGIASGGVLVIGILFVIENVGSKYREFVGTLALLSDGFSEVILSAIAWFSTTWRMYVLLYSSLSIFVVLAVMILPETPRWLISKGRTDDAIKVLTKAAKCNKMSTENIEEIISEALQKMKSADIRRTMSYQDFFRIKGMPLRIISSFVIWTSGGICYFDINQFITYLGSNVYIAVALLGIMQIPKLPIAIFFNKYFGRKLSTIGSLLTTCFTMFTLIFLDHDNWLGITLGVISFSGTCILFAVLYVYTSELFPTPLRNMAYGLSSMGSKMGAMVASFIAVLSPHWIPFLIFASITFCSNNVLFDVA